jgi:hypothetical protein
MGFNAYGYNKSGEPFLTAGRVWRHWLCHRHSQSVIGWVKFQRLLQTYVQSPSQTQDRPQDLTGHAG